MFIIQCPQCDAQHLVTNTHIQSTHSTSEGIVGYVRCAAGHTVMHRFPAAYPKPPRPACLDELDADTTDQALTA